MTGSIIKIHVVTQFLPEQSSEDYSKYAFAYHITIENRGDRPSRLVSRHWIITDGNENKQEVQGLGVVGEQPRLAPGEKYQYTSGVVLDTPVGTMQGTYHMVNDDGEPFDAPIAPFLLAVPGMVH